MNKLAVHPRLDFDRDTFVFLGDYVDGGPQAAQVIDSLMMYQQRHPHWQFLLGNHEDLMLNALGVRDTLANPYIHTGDYYLWYTQGGKETYFSYAERAGLTDFEKAIAKPADIIAKGHTDWLCSLPLTFETDSYIFVHAGLRPNETATSTRDCDKLWIRDEFLTSDYDWGKTVVVGHTYQRTQQPYIAKNLMCLDTMHHGGGAISAAILDDTKRGEVEIVQSYSENR